jgi:hypothetical protein
MVRRGYDDYNKADEFHDNNDDNRGIIGNTILSIIIISAILVLILTVIQSTSNEYASIYFSSNDVNDSSIINIINFSFVIENHFKTSKEIPYSVFVDNNLIENGIAKIDPNESVTKNITIPFNKNSFSQKIVSVTLPDLNQEIHFGAGLKVKTTFVNNIAFVDGNISPSIIDDSNNIITVNLAWAALDRIDKNYMIFVHFINESNQIAFQNDGYLTINGNTIATSQWPIDTLLRDSVSITVPSDIADGNYRALAGMYLVGSPRIKTRSGEDFVRIGEITVERVG